VPYLNDVVEVDSSQSQSQEGDGQKRRKLLCLVSDVGGARYSSSKTRLPVLDVLPRSYTALHGKVAQVVSYDYPAICLACGLVLDAGGKGQCTRHAGLCCADGAMFFLVQDCMVLLLHGVRASYFPPPYVDEHGERHKSYRGRPLYMDAKRSEVLRALWACHGIPGEVVLKRSVSARVIINSHY
jgi:hypothetical protein